MLEGDLKTIKELADTLNTTKNRVAYQVRKLPDDGVEIVDGIKYLTQQSQITIIKAIEKLDSVELNSDKETETTIKSDNFEEVIEALNQQITLLQEQLYTKDKQIDQLHTIIATQSQRLNTKLLEKEKDNSKSWWRRLFGK